MKTILTIRKIITGILLSACLLITSPLIFAQGDSGCCTKTIQKLEAINTSLALNAPISNYLKLIYNALIISPSKTAATLLNSIGADAHTMSGDIHTIRKQLEGVGIDNFKHMEANITSNYIAYSNVTKESDNYLTDMFNDLNNLIQFGPTGPSVTLGTNITDQDRNHISNQSSYQNPIKTPIPTAKDYLGTNQYNFPYKEKKPTAAQQKLEDFIENISGVGMGIPMIPKAQSEDAKRYNVRQRMFAGIQSIAIYNLVKAYTDRVSISGNSKLSLLNKISTGTAENTAQATEQFWKIFAKQSLFGKLTMLASSFFSMNFALQHISQQLDQIRVELAAMISEQTIIATQMTSPKPPLSYETARKAERDFQIKKTS